MVSAVFLALTWWESVVQKGSQSLSRSWVPTWMLGVLWLSRQVLFVPSPSGQPCTPPSQPQGPGAQPLYECSTGWLSLRQLM